MHIKPLAAAALTSMLLASVGAGAATRTIYDSASFVPIEGGLVRLDGFGRATINSFGTLSLATPNAAAREPFFDTWNIDVSSVAAGTYSFESMLVDATGSLLFSTSGFAVTFNSIDEQGVRQTVLFDVNATGTQAVGSGSFTVRGSCPIASCVWIDVTGTQEVGTLGGYGGTTIAAVVPEPASYALLGLGLLVVGAQARRHHRRSV